MKTYSFLIVLAVITFSATKIQASVEPYFTSYFYQMPEMSIPFDINGTGPIISFEIGRKKFDCEKFGVCWTKIDPNIKLETPALGRSASGTGAVIGKKLTVEFYRTSMNDETYKIYFSGGNFIVEDDFEMPSEVTRALGLESYTIKAGIYPITEVSENKLLVNF